MMVLPFVENGSLADLIKRNPEFIQGIIFVQIVSPYVQLHKTACSRNAHVQIIGIGRALVYLHSRNPQILHGDLHTVSQTSYRTLTLC